ncbi:MAG: hypothetical protein M3136_06245 [Thermoproteota archaeon]|nr:hypothetical protein [Thermoproteota archaeon]MDQ4017960.1 hypothetical protein [Thermoproteota archaeon]
MPKRRIKEEKPKRKVGKKELLIAPVAMGAATLVALVIIPTFAPPPNPAQVCLKEGQHNIESFQLYPRIEVIVDGKQMMLPDNVGRQPKDGQECLRPIHTDEVGNVVHIEYIRPIRFTLGDFMSIYNMSNAINVVDNSTGTGIVQTLNLPNYNTEYSYFSEAGEFTEVARPSDMPPFPQDNKIVARVNLTSK